MESNKQNALALKEVGNNLFKEKKYQEAIECYTEAISLDPHNTIFFSNRSRCYKMIGKLEQGYEDALKAAQLDQKNIKAHLLAGQILILIAQNEKQANKVQTAIQKIKRCKQIIQQSIKFVFLPRKKIVLTSIKINHLQSEEKVMESKSGQIEREKKSTKKLFNQHCIK